jgi:hypothetical protein
MSSDLDVVLTEWAHDWQSAPADADVSPRSIRRMARRHFWVGILNMVFGLAMLVFYTAWAAVDRDPALVVAAVAVWVFVLAAAIFDLWNRRGKWRAAHQSTSEYVELVHRQLQARLRAIRFAWGLLVAETAFLVPWVAWAAARNPDANWMSYMRSYAFLCLMVGGFAIVVLPWLRHRAMKQLRGVVGLRQSFGLTELESNDPE